MNKEKLYYNIDIENLTKVIDLFNDTLGYHDEFCTIDTSGINTIFIFNHDNLKLVVSPVSHKGNLFVINKYEPMSLILLNLLNEYGVFSI